MPILGKLRGSAATNEAKDPALTSLMPLQKLLQDAGPLRDDGSDKFFGMENAQSENACFCNSILQCLYYSVPFREAVINYPRRAPQDSLDASLAKNLHYPDLDAPIEDPKPKQQQQPVSNAARTAGVPVNTPQKPEEDKNSQEYKKKVAMHRLPLLDTSDNASGYGMNESLFTSLKDIFESVIASPERTGIIRPNHFLEVLRREYEPFRPRVHQDAHEFLNLLLNVVVADVEAEARRTSPDADQQSDSHKTGTTDSASASTTAVNGTKSPTNTRWVHELFEGTLTSETQCLTCEQVSQRDEVFLDLSVDLAPHGSVTSCLRKFSEEEMLCERNKFHCDNCGGLQEAEKRMKVKRLPRVLALHLKRFEYTDDFQRMYKLFHRVPYPDHLRLFNTTDDVEDPDRLYELYAVVVHIGGGPHHGHYVAIIKTENKGWLLFDDELVEPVSRTYVRNFFGDRSSQACAYVLFYQETTIEAVQKEMEKEEMQPAQTNAPDLKETLPLPKMNGTAAAPNNLRRANSTMAEGTNWKQTMHLSSHGDNPAVPVPPTPPTPKSPFGALTSRKSDIHLKRVRTKEEKISEKEKEKSDKQNRKDQEAKAKEEQKRREAEQKEEKHRQADLSKSEKEDNSHGGAFSHGLSRLKVRRKSTSHSKVNKTHQENPRDSSDVPPVPHIPTVHVGNANHTRPKQSTELTNDHPPENNGNGQKGSSTTSTTEQHDEESRDKLGHKPSKRTNEKPRRFSFKKRSFSVF